MDTHLSAAVALSGGVDSSVAALLLKQAGWDVCAVHFSLSPLDAQNHARIQCIAQKIGIPLEILDLQDRFENHVVTPFCETYLRGETPNPCVLCNQIVKFHSLYRYVQAQDIQHLATGHYVRRARHPNTGGVRLLRGLDRGKDQSYFLQRLGQDSLSKAVFPLGDLSKEAVRKKAQREGLLSFLRPESQEICFISGMDYRRFVENKRGPLTGMAEGDIVDAEGEALGRHAGVYRYTIGQRHGLGIASPMPYYVKELRPGLNQVVVGRREALFSRVVQATDVNWIEGAPPEGPVGLEAQVRYRHRPAAGRLEIISRNTVRFIFDGPQWAVTPGQALALYDGDQLIGGGWIAKDRSSKLEAES